MTIKIKLHSLPENSDPSTAPKFAMDTTEPYRHKEYKDVIKKLNNKEVRMERHEVLIQNHKLMDFQFH